MKSQFKLVNENIASIVQKHTDLESKVDDLSTHLDNLEDKLADTQRQVGELQIKANARTAAPTITPPNQAPALTTTQIEDLARSTPTTKSVPFCADEIGFFDPFHTQGVGGMVTGKELQFRDVHLFTDQLKEIVELKGEQLIKVNLLSCLQSSALSWHQGELSLEQQTRQRTSSLEYKLDTLIDRFKKPQSNALSELTTLCFTPTHV